MQPCRCRGWVGRLGRHKGRVLLSLLHHSQPLRSPPLPPCDAMQDDEHFEVVPHSDFIISRTAHRDNTSNYYINDRKSSFGEVTTLLKGKGVDLDNNRFLILQVRRLRGRVVVWERAGYLVGEMAGLAMQMAPSGPALLAGYPPAPFPICSTSTPTPHPHPCTPPPLPPIESSRARWSRSP